MSELINTTGRSKHVLWQLLSTASALVLMGTVSAASGAKAADDEDRPTVWIELGGSLQRVDTSEEKYIPPFLLQSPRPSPETVDPLNVGHLPRNSFNGEGKITFQPEDSTWKFSAGAIFGRSTAHQSLHQQSHSTGPLAPPPVPSAIPYYQHIFEFIDAKKTSSVSHAILDFQVGKDVGFGMFGTVSSSTFNLGVRFAQFNSRSSTSFGSDPDAHIFVKIFSLNGLYIPFITNAFYHTHNAASSASRSLRGFGPSVSWNVSDPVIGNDRAGEISLDWGVNAALLFGRQKAKIHHQSTARYHHGKYYNVPVVPSYPDPGHDFSRSRMVTVPNIGAFAGLTYQIQNFKINAGYRADFFFGALDGGIDTRKTEDEKFYGPFATISIGLGG